MPTGSPKMNVSFGVGAGIPLDRWSALLKKVAKHCDSIGIADLTGYTLSNQGRTVNLHDPQQQLVWTTSV